MTPEPNGKKWTRRTWFCVGAVLLIAASAGLVAGLRLRGGGPPNVPVPAAVAKQYAGTYYHGDGLGCNIGLTLGTNGRFDCTWEGCMGHYGDANGNWSVSNNTLTITPYKEAGMLKGHLRKLDIVQTKQGIVFVEPRDRNHFKEYGANSYWCYMRADQRK